MCGIAAVFGDFGESSDRVAHRMLGRMRHRGDPHLGLEMKVGSWWAIGANRMAITSPSEAVQPATRRSGRTLLAMNGEIYNYRELAEHHLENASETIRLGDTEVVESLLEACGHDAIAQLDGMFALISLDTEARTLSIARDRFGVKPLYYAIGDGWVLVASELKALAAEAKVGRIEFAAPGCWTDFTLSRSGYPRVRITQFGSSLVCSGEDDDHRSLAEKLRSAVAACVPKSGQLGVLLSGGVDSGSVYAIAKREYPNTIAVCVGRDESSDVKCASALARSFGDEVLVKVCPPEQALFEDVAETVRIMESFEPNVVRQGSISRVIADACAEQSLRVVLCGEGADELFGGYPEFLTQGRDLIALRAAFLNDLHRTQLQRVDRSAMWATTEVRVPFLLREIADSALRLSSLTTPEVRMDGEVLSKPSLRAALIGVVPETVRLRPKVVLSEGAGLGGNDPGTGLFGSLAASAISARDVRELQHAFPEWNISGPEDALYFSYFLRNGYEKGRFASERVYANRVSTL